MAATLILVEGDSGTGKSTSVRNLDYTSTYLLTPNGKPLPFRGGKSKYNTGNKNLKRVKDFVEVPKYLKAISDKRPEIKTIVIDDFTHLFNSRVLSKNFVATKGFDKWSVLAQDVYDTITGTCEDLRDDLIIVFMSHTVTEADATGGKTIKMRTAGKLLDNSVNLPSYFTYILHTDVQDREDGTKDYKFLTNTDGTKEAKTPLGCFDELFIDNDLSDIIETIIEYENGDVVMS